MRRTRVRRRRAASYGPVTSARCRGRAGERVRSARRRPTRIGLPRCRSGDDRPSGADRPKTWPPPSEDEEPLNTEPPSRDRPTPTPPRPGAPSREPPNTPARRRPPNLTRAEPAASPPGVKVAPARVAGRPSLSWGSRRAAGRPAAGPAQRHRPILAPVPLGQPQPPGRSRRRSCLIAPWFVAGTAGPRLAGRPAGPVALAAHAGQAQRRRGSVQHERAEQHVVGHGERAARA